MLYDVAIVGAGPAGSWLARELARSGFHTVLLERSAALGEPNFSSAVSPDGVVESFDLPRRAVAVSWTSARVVGPRSAVTWHYEKPAGVVFNFRELKAGLITEAAEAGAEIRLAAVVTAAEFGSYETTLLTRSGDRIQSRIVVDASGWARVLTTQLGLMKSTGHPAVGVELICRVARIPEHLQGTVEFYLGRNWAPHGYAWVFPMSDSEVKIGVCVYRLKRYPALKLGEVLENFVARMPWLRNCARLEKHGGFGHLRGGVKQHVVGNVLAIGDAADQINPLAGEGIRHALASARFAHGVIGRALKTGCVSDLKKYDQLWREYIRHRWKACAITADMVYRFTPDVVFELLTHRFGKLTPKEAIEVGFGYRSVHLLASLFRGRDRALVSASNLS